MNLVIAVVSAWWMVGLGVVGGSMLLGVLWRWVFADLVLATVELP